MSYQLTGKIKLIKDVKQVSEKFKVREFVVTVDDGGNYAQDIQLQATNDKCDALNAYTTGSDVTVSFNLRGREWTSPQGEVKYFNSLDAWKIEAGVGVSDSGAAPSVIPENQLPVDTSGQEDELPF